MSRSMWIIIILITILMISSYWFSKNKSAPPWVKCKESLFEQVVFKKCTPSSFFQPGTTNSETKFENYDKQEQNQQ